MAIERERIVKKHLLLAEGTDAMYFFIQMLSSPRFSSDKRLAEEIQVMDFGGIKDLSRFLQLLRLREGFSDVESILIVRDAEDDAQGAVKSIRDSLLFNGYPASVSSALWCCSGEPRTAYVLLPSLSKDCSNGALEDLCCSLINEEDRDDILGQVDTFLDTMKITQGYSYPRIFKNRLHTYLSAKDEYVSLKIGEAARANAFDWTSEKLDDFRALLPGFFS